MSPIESETTLRLTRVFKASRERVFKAFCDPEILRQWWCPDGFEFTHIEIDPETGLGCRFHMTDGATGDKYVWDMIYHEVDEPNRLKWTSLWIEGFAANDNHETVATVEFREVAGGTEVTLIHEGFPDKDARDGHGQGWGGGLDKLERLLSKG